MTTVDTETLSPNRSLAPMLAVRQGAKAIEFYRAALGAVEVYRVESPDGEVISRLSAGGAEFWVTDESPEHGSVSPTTAGAATARMILTVPDPDAAFRRFTTAAATGVTVIHPVVENYGWRLCHLIDPFGHHWEIGHPLDDARPH